jgi:ribosome maturation factor RimP
MEFELVQVRLMGGSRRTLQVMAEPLDHGRVMTVDDCAEISHAVSALLDVEDPIPGAYVLEVTSPGLDRPLVRAADYERFAGERARIEVDPPIAGRRRFQGVLRGKDGEDVVIRLEGSTERLPLATIRRARLVPADAPIARAGQSPRGGSRSR